jgi:hypothetical protein
LGLLVYVITAFAQGASAIEEGILGTADSLNRTSGTGGWEGSPIACHPGKEANTPYVL